MAAALTLGRPPLFDTKASRAIGFATAATAATSLRRPLPAPPAGGWDGSGKGGATPPPPLPPMVPFTLHLPSDPILFDWLKVALRVALAALGLLISHQVGFSATTAAVAIVAGCILSTPATLVAVSAVLTACGTWASSVGTFAIGGSPFHFPLGVAAILGGALAIHKHGSADGIGLLEWLYNHKVPHQMKDAGSAFLVKTFRWLNPVKST